tara:strand:- start:123 stop:356 length:234 start_codon:yes stop_codon:yes gene_type:complete
MILGVLIGVGAVASLVFIVGSLLHRSPQHDISVHLLDSICLIINAKAEAETVIKVPKAKYSLGSIYYMITFIFLIKF